MPIVGTRRRSRPSPLDQTWLRYEGPARAAGPAAPGGRWREPILTAVAREADLLDRP
ncbi:hypothetical protein ACSNOD_23405 [Streptomyces sp. URMC 123]